MKKSDVWSFTKSQVWNSCRKKYYYSYIKGYEDDELADRIKKIQEYRSIYLTKGELIHQAIAEYICSNKCGIKHSLETDAENAAKKILRLYYEETCLEKLNNIAMSDESINAVASDIHSCLHMFQKRFWPQMSRYSYAGVEKSIYFSLGKWRAMGKIDYIATDGKETVIVDWKSGSPSQDDKKQALVYCMCVMHESSVPVENIRAEIAYLYAGKKGNFRPLAYSIQAMEAEIMKECEEMFTMNEEPEGTPGDKCIFCPYYSLCEDSAEIKKKTVLHTASDVTV